MIKVRLLLSQIFIAALLQSSMNASAQLALLRSPHHVQAPEGPVVREGQAQSEATALSILSRFVIATGGIDEWQQYRIVETHYVPSVRSGPDREMFLLDDWSGDTTRYRRGHHSANYQPRDHDGSQLLPSDPHYPGISIPEFDQAHVLVDHLPTPAALVLLRSRAYIVQQSLDCPPTDNCISVYSKTPSGAYEFSQEWRLSRTTGLLEQAFVKMPRFFISPKATPSARKTGVVLSRPVWQEYNYAGWKHFGTVQVPQDISASSSDGHETLRYLTAFERRSAFDKASFDEELHR